MLDVNGGEREENERCSEPVYGGLQLRSHVLATGIGTLHFSAYMVNDTEHLEHQFLLVGLWFDALTFPVATRRNRRLTYAAVPGPFHNQ